MIIPLTAVRAVRWDVDILGTSNAPVVELISKAALVSNAVLWAPPSLIRLFEPPQILFPMLIPFPTVPLASSQVCPMMMLLSFIEFCPEYPPSTML
jgi:hypothetical protein